VWTKGPSRDSYALFCTHTGLLSRHITHNAHDFPLQLQVTTVATLRMGEHLLREVT